jgi:hypothetical protein
MTEYWTWSPRKALVGMAEKTASDVAYALGLGDRLKTYRAIGTQTAEYDANDPGAIPKCGRLEKVIDAGNLHVGGVAQHASSCENQPVFGRYHVDAAGIQAVPVLGIDHIQPGRQLPSASC